MRRHPPQERFELFVALVLGILGLRLLRTVVRPREPAGDPRERIGQNVTAAVWGVALAVGVVGGVYGIGGAALIAPLLVGVLGLRLRSVVGSTLVATFLTSLMGVATFALLARAGSPQAAPDWTFGVSAGLGGLAGSYAGARLHTYLPERLMQTGLATLILGLAISYLVP